MVQGSIYSKHDLGLLHTFSSFDGVWVYKATHGWLKGTTSEGARLVPKVEDQGSQSNSTRSQWPLTTFQYTFWNTYPFWRPVGYGCRGLVDMSSCPGQGALSRPPGGRSPVVSFFPWLRCSWASCDEVACGGSFPSEKPIGSWIAIREVFTDVHPSWSIWRIGKLRYTYTLQ